MTQRNPNNRQIPDRRFDEIGGLMNRAAHFSIRCDISNFLESPVDVIEGTGRRHRIERTVNHGVGRCLVVILTITGQSKNVKINADADYFEQYTFDIIKRFSPFSSQRVVKDPSGYHNLNEYRAYMVFDYKDIVEINHEINIPECGIMLTVDRGDGRTRDSTAAWLDRLRGTPYPPVSVPVSGLTAIAVDRTSNVDKLYYSLGSRLFEIGVDRNSRGVEGIYFGNWNRVNGLGSNVEESHTHLTMEQALTGNNEIGVKVFTNRIDAERFMHEKMVTPAKEGSEWERREQGIKLTHSIVKVAGDVIKSILPPVIRAIGTIIGLFTKVPVPK